MVREGGGSSRPAARIVAAAMDAYVRGDLDALASSVHPEAEIEMLLLRRQAGSRSGGTANVLVDARETVHRPTVTSIEAIADDAALMTGRIQHRDASGAISDHKAVWLTVLRDGKLWPTRVLASRLDGAAASRSEGLTAGAHHLSGCGFIGGPWRAPRRRAPDRRARAP